MKIAKTIICNVLVLITLLIFVEVAARLTTAAWTCLGSNCSSSLIKKLKVRNVSRDVASRNIGISRFDDDLGYVPREGFDGVIDQWNNARVTITSDGFRANDSDIGERESSVLVVGDSYTFGATVSNEKTWPACLERKIGSGVDNGGVFGYGAAQSLKRAQLNIEDKQYTSLVFSVLVPNDFARDRLIYRSGFSKPAIIITADGIGWSSVPNPNISGTKYNPSANNRFLSYFYERSLIAATIIDGMFPEIDLTGDRLTIQHPNAADLDSIIEWTLNEFSGIDVEHKVLMLQYSHLNNQKLDERQADKRDKIMNIARRLSLSVVDTFEALKNYDEKATWRGHHTEFGNEIVCEYLFEEEFKPASAVKASG